MTDIAITALNAHQILDSRGYPTVAVTMTLADGAVFEASAPAGASTGANEAVERRDGESAFSGRGVTGAVGAVSGEIAGLLLSHDWASLQELDDAVGELDGTGNYSRLGANAVVAVSIAATRAFAHLDGLPLYSWINRLAGQPPVLPVPHFNVLNGGAHAANDLDFQEFMIAPRCAKSEAEAVQIGSEVYHALAARIRDRYSTSGLGDEGGFAPPVSRIEDALELLVTAISDAGYQAGVDQVAIALDPAANGFYTRDGIYRVAGNTLSRDDLAGLYAKLVDEYPIWSIEDGFAEDDHEGWRMLYDRLADRIQLVGDDLYVTDATRISEGARSRLSNAALIKPNQIGTVSQTLAAIEAARSSGMRCMVSHRSGETMDTFIADLAVGTGVGQIKAGAPARGERVAKYNRLMEIETEAGDLGYGLEDAGQ